MKITILLYVLFSLSVNAQKKNCNDFKTGKFIYLHSDYSQWKVVRTENKQIETDDVLGITVEATIEWKSDCEYILTYTKISDPNAQGLVGDKIRVKIMEVHGNRIICRSNQKNIKLELEMEKIE